MHWNNVLILTQGYSDLICDKIVVTTLELLWKPGCSLIRMDESVNLSIMLTCFYEYRVC